MVLVWSFVYGVLINLSHDFDKVKYSGKNKKYRVVRVCLRVM